MADVKRDEFGFPVIGLPDNFPIEQEISEDAPKPPTKPTGFKGKKIARLKAQRTFHENLPLAANFIAGLLKRKHSSKDPISSEEMKLLMMQKDAAETIIAHGLGRPGTQSLPKARTDAPPPVDFNFGNMADLKKQGVPKIEREDTNGGN